MKLLADLHVHSRASLDGRSSVEALIETARTRGLSAITVSDHDLCTPLPDCKDLFLIPGVEITSANGHILGLFLDAPIDFAALGKFPPPAQAIAAIHASGGLAVLAHPFAPQKLNPEEIARLGFDAIETANARAMLKPGANEKARQLAQELSLPGTGGSDAHCAKELGGCVTEFSCEPSPAALLGLFHGSFHIGISLQNGQDKRTSSCPQGLIANANLLCGLSQPALRRRASWRSPILLPRSSDRCR